MKTNSVVNDLIAKIVSHLKGVKSKEISLHKIKYSRGNPTFWPLPTDQSAIEIFSPSVKGAKQIEIFHVQVRKQPSDKNLSFLVEPDPSNPVFVRLSQAEISER